MKTIETTQKHLTCYSESKATYGLSVIGVILVTNTAISLQVYKRI